MLSPEKFLSIAALGYEMADHPRSTFPLDCCALGALGVGAQRRPPRAVVASYIATSLAFFGAIVLLFAAFRRLGEAHGGRFC